ncbi:MAG: stalk domain-containing protein [Pelotomaculaceae bacterium]
MVPLRFVSEALGAEVNWKQDSKGGVVDISF